MNDALKNIFDEDSLNAIRNAATVVPTPKSSMRVGNIVAGLKDTKNDNQKEIIEDVAEPRVEYKINDHYEERIKELNGMIDQHAIIINDLIKSQNELISQIKVLNNKKPEISEREASKVEVPSQKEEINETKEIKEENSNNKQQTSSCSNLDPNDFAVENIFYFGNK